MKEHIIIAAIFTLGFTMPLILGVLFLHLKFRKDTLYFLEKIHEKKKNNNKKYIIIYDNKKLKRRKKIRNRRKNIN